MFRVTSRPVFAAFLDKQESLSSSMLKSDANTLLPLKWNIFLYKPLNIVIGISCRSFKDSDVTWLEFQKQICRTYHIFIIYLETFQFMLSV